MVSYPAIIIDDDHEDVDLINQALRQLAFNGEVIVFDDSVAALHYLQNINTPPLFILCDVNMQQMNGISLREALFANERIKIKTIPFLFFSTSSAPPHIYDAYNLCAQGYFIKPSDFDKLVEILDIIIRYWTLCSRPQAY